MDDAPKTFHVTEEMGGITVSLPRRGSALARHLVEKLGHIALAMILLGLWGARIGLFFSIERIGVAVLMVLLFAAWAAYHYRIALDGGRKQKLHVTPQRIVFPDKAVLLESVEALRLDLDRGRLSLHTPEGVVPVLGELDYAELVWLRGFIEHHISARRATLGISTALPNEVPAELQALRER